MKSLDVLRLISIFCGFSFLLFGVESVLLSPKKGYLSIWRGPRLQNDFIRALPFPRFFAEAVAKTSSLTWLGALQISASLALILSGKVFYVGVLFFVHWLICFRFRGTLNGGSDMMAFVILTGLFIGGLTDDEKIQRLGLVYISIHLVYSYLKAGFVKVRSGDWRSGRALPVFLKRSLSPFVRVLGKKIENLPRLGTLLCWLVIFFELGVGLIFIFPEAKLLFFGLAVGFHFSIYLFFGLNRFFWMWMSAWPALLFAITLTKAGL